MVFLLPVFKCLAQESIKGEIISEIDNYEEILIVNTTRNTFTKIDNDGKFEISAFLNDTIKVNSHSYDETNFVVSEKVIGNGIQISLKDNIKDLKEIIIDSNFINDEELAEINQQLQSQIKNDIKNNPYEYTKPTSGFNIFGVFELAYDLIRKKNPKVEQVPEVFITHQDLNMYFEKDNTYLIKELSIPEDQIPSFFLFIEDQQISNKLLNDSNQFFFLEELIKLKNKFIDN